jgi:hypothetical protein
MGFWSLPQLMLLACAGSVAAPRTVDAQTVDGAAARQEIVRQLGEGLESHAEWCRNERLFGERKRALEALIVLRPDDTQALRALGYTKGSQGRWTPPKNDRQPRDFDAASLAEARSRFDALLATYADALDGLAASHLLSREEVLADLRRVAPDHPRVHAAAGEVQQDGEWLLGETVEALRRRSEIAAWTRDIAALLPASAPPSARETALGLDWTDALETEDARILGTVERRELCRMARSLAVTRTLFGRLLGREVRLAQGTTIFLLDGATDCDRFLRAHPALTDRQRGEMARLTGVWIQGDSHDIAFWEGGEEHRLDGVVHLVCHSFLRQAFGFAMERWEQEGLALFLTECVLGTRLTWCSGAATVACNPAQARLRARMLESPDWLAEAARRSELPGWTCFDGLCARRWGEYSPEDQLCAYALAAYLVEGQHELAPRFLQYLAGGQRSSATAVADVLGRTSVELDQRLQRWLRERLAHEPAGEASVASGPGSR